MVDEVAHARTVRKDRDIEREMDAAVIRDSILAGSPANSFKLLKEFKMAAQSYVEHCEEAEQIGDDYSPKHYEWFRELLK